MMTMFQRGEKRMNLSKAGSLAAALFVLASLLPAQPSGNKEQHLLYVASPGIRNYEEYGGVGILVFDIDNGYRFLKRIPTWDVPAGQKPENVKGIAASAKVVRQIGNAEIACFQNVRRATINQRPDARCVIMCLEPIVKS